MESWDEEVENSTEHALNYYFTDENYREVPFSILPVQWDDNEGLAETERDVVLRGTCEYGIRSLFVPVMAWKFELSYVRPEIYVLSKSNKWILLEKPRNVFKPLVENVLITVHWLHFVRRNPDASEATALGHLRSSFSSYDNPKFLDFLLDHKPLIMKAAKRDEAIEASKAFCEFVERCENRKPLHEDHHTSDDTSGEDEKEEEGFFRAVCAICDDGGNLLFCNGRCLRGFHPMEIDGVGAKCVSLGFRSKIEYESIPVFRCKNCLAMQHQCYACGRLGSSAKSSNQEVFPCASATCGHFYHPVCVSRLLHAGDQNQAKDLADKIIAGESFVCPAHRCFRCNQPEDADVHELQLAICRRCPRVYHRKCLPSGIVFPSESTETNLTRAWEELLPKKRILIYCLKHKICPVLETPLRDHIIFPNGGINRTKVSGILLSKNITPSKRKLDEDSHSGVRIGDSSKKAKGYAAEGFGNWTKSNRAVPAEKEMEKVVRPVSVQSTLAPKSKFVDINNYKQQSIAGNKVRNFVPDKPVIEKTTISMPSSDPDMEKGILALMDEVESEFDIEEYKQRRLPRSSLYRSKISLERSMPLGRVETSVEAVRTALKKIEEGYSIDDAKTLCPPEVLTEICRWKKMLSVQLAPFFHGSRYTSYGRHFTQVEKLKEIIDRLQWYVQDGDTIVDFCCGSNDFSCLLKEQLERSGRSCQFKNYDIIQAKNEFCFEKRDWMDVKVDELPDGSQLIMGLNPPFGTNACLANQFINKALQFNPKLIVLIVPKQAQRLDKKAPYQLVWQDDALLSGKAFYLPGSVNVDDKKIDDWNIKPPPLYLWSRVDWVPAHVAIAQACGHLPI